MADTPIDNTEKTIILVSALPPSRSRAGLTALNLIKVLCETVKIICVVDDTGPTPTPIQGTDIDNVSFMRIRDFRRGHHPYATTPRIFILDEGFDSLFALELFCEIGGAALPISSSMHRSLRALMEEKSAWPNNYATLLGARHGNITALQNQGFNLMGALMDFKRDSQALASEIPTLDFLHQASRVLALSDFASIYLEACGINASRIHLPTVGQNGTITRKQARAQLGLGNKGLFIIAVSTQTDKDRVEKALQLAVGIQKPTLVINIMAMGSPFLAILASNVSVVLGANEGALISTFTETAINANIPLITVFDPVNIHVNECSGMIELLDHADAIHGLALKLVQIEVTVREEKEPSPSIKDIAPQSTKDNNSNDNTLLHTKNTHTIEQLFSLLNEANYSAYVPTITETENIASDAIHKTHKIDPKQISGSAIFIGAAPGAMLLSSIMPGVDSSLSARFLPFDTAQSLEALLALPMHMAVARFGYETPILSCSPSYLERATLSEENDTNRRIWDYDQIIRSTRATDHVVFCHQHTIAPGNTNLLDLKGLKHQLILSRDPGLSENERWHFSKSQGMAWRLDIHRRSIHIILITAGYDIKFSWASVTEQNMKTTVSVSNEYDTRMLSSTPVRLQSSSCGILDFRITISGNLETGPLTAEEALSYIQNNPIMIEWANISEVPSFGCRPQISKNVSTHHDNKKTNDNLLPSKDSTMRTEEQSDLQASNRALSLAKVNKTPILKPDERLTNAAINYTDILLSAQRQQFDSLVTTLAKRYDVDQFSPTLPETTSIFVEGDNFMGAGWSDLAQSPCGAQYRWMPRIASLLIVCGPEREKRIEINGFGISRQRLLISLNIFLGNKKISGKVKRTGIRTWSFEGTLPAISKAEMCGHYQILRFENKKAARLKKSRDYSELGIPQPTKSHKDLMLGEDGGHIYASLGVNSILISDV
jgi:hypothetical protein